MAAVLDPVKAVVPWLRALAAQARAMPCAKAAAPGRCPEVALALAPDNVWERAAQWMLKATASANAREPALENVAVR